VGELILFLIDVHPINIRNPEKVTKPEIAILPKSMKMPPTLEVNANSPAYLRMRQNEFMAAVQKLSLVSATWMYALEVMYLMKRSMQARQHRIQPTTHSTSLLSPAVSLRCFYRIVKAHKRLTATNSKITLMHQTTAIMKEPKANDPRLYLQIHLIPDL
jgi:hypothetical protein